MTREEEEEEKFSYQNEGGRPCRICAAPRRYKRTEPNGVRVFVCTSNDITIIPMMLQMCNSWEMMV